MQSFTQILYALELLEEAKALRELIFLFDWANSVLNFLSSLPLLSRGTVCSLNLVLLV